MTQDNAKSVLMVLAHYNFRDEEYLAAREKLKAAGAKVTVASTVTKDAFGIQGLKMDPDILIDDANPDDYDAIVFVGGVGASQYWHDVSAHNIATAAATDGKIVAASSHAAVTLAVAGLLAGKKATGHVTVYEKLIVAGADYTGQKIVVDGKIITSSGANAAQEFADALADAIR